MTGRFLKERQISPETFDSLVLGITVTQRQDFYGAPWLAGLIGATGVTGPNISQACATSARMVATAAASGILSAAASTAAPPRLWPINSRGARCLRRR